MTTMIQVEHATKSFTMSYQRSLKQTVLAKARGRKTHDSFNAVDDVSFTVSEGESVGLMGLNGSGKSTLLKLISGVMRPDSGSVLTRGRIAGLIATGCVVRGAGIRIAPLYQGASTPDTSRQSS